MDRVSAEFLDQRLEQGWVRSGPALYRTDMLCLNNELQGLLQIRLVLADWQASREQRRILKRNRRNWHCTFGGARINAQRERLYQAMKPRFQGMISNRLEPLVFGANQDIFDTRECRVYDQEKLVAISYFDIGKHSVASQIGLHDPAYQRFSLGQYTMLEEIDFTIEHGGHYYYPGYLILNSPGFAYKLKLGNLEYRHGDGHWRPLSAPPPHLPSVRRIMARIEQLENALTKAGIGFQRFSYPAFWVAYLSNQTSDYLSALMHVKCSHFPNRSTFHVIEYLHEADNFQLSLVSPDNEINIAEDIDALPRHYQLATLRYERILCQESSAERVARQVTALSQQG